MYPANTLNMTIRDKFFVVSILLLGSCKKNTDPVQPVIPGTTLYVSDYETGRIGVFDLAKKTRIGTIDTKSRGIAGILLTDKAL